MPDNQPSKEELDRIIRIWNQKHPKYKGMLEAQPYELGEDSDWYWSQTERQYIDKNDNKVPWTVIGGLVVALMVGNKLSAPTYGGLSTYAQLAEGLKSGVLSVADWKAGMQSLITMGQQTGILVSNGGVEFMTNADWTYTQQQIEKQFAFLDGFAKDITDNPEKWLNGRLDNRMRLYQESAYSAYQNGLRREATLGGMDEERRVLGAADHCPGCLEQAGLGWQPIGTLDEIGAEECNQNCVVGETIIQSPEIEIIYKRLYSGKVIDLFTTNGNTLTVTPNHPLLTNHGWVAANLIKNGDNLVSASLAKKMLFSNPNVQQTPSMISDVFASFNKLWHSGRFMGADHQFHGDGMNGNVDIIFPQRKLASRVLASAFDPFDDLQFSTANNQPAFSSFNKDFFSFFLTAPGFLSFFRKLASFFKSSFSHPHIHGVRAISDCNIVVNKPLSNNPATNGVTHTYRKFALARNIRFDNVVDVRIREVVNIHVYNLQTKYDWYICNNIITHNCRCEFEYQKAGEATNEEDTQNTEAVTETKQPDTAEKILSDTQEYQSKNETEDMKFARQDYATDGYKEINTRLRDGTPLGEDLGFISNQLDQGFISNPGIANEMTVFRGANIDASQFTTGTTFKDNAFVSTSLSKNEVASFARKGSENPVIMEISMPQGSKIFSPSLAGDQFAYEKEVLLPRGSEFKVADVSTLNDIYTYIKLEYLP